MHEQEETLRKAKGFYFWLTTITVFIKSLKEFNEHWKSNIKSLLGIISLYRLCIVYIKFEIFLFKQSHPTTYISVPSSSYVCVMVICVI